MFIPQINVGRYSSDFVIVPTFVKCCVAVCSHLVNVKNILHPLSQYFLFAQDISASM